LAEKMMRRIRQILDRSGRIYTVPIICLPKNVQRYREQVTSKGWGRGLLSRVVPHLM
jgi:hypothetical protein